MSRCEKSEVVILDCLAVSNGSHFGASRMRLRQLLDNADCSAEGCQFVHRQPLD